MCSDSENDTVVEIFQRSTVKTFLPPRRKRKNLAEISTEEAIELKIFKKGDNNFGRCRVKYDRTSTRFSKRVSAYFSAGGGQVSLSRAIFPRRLATGLKRDTIIDNKPDNVQYVLLRTSRAWPCAARTASCRRSCTRSPGACSGSASGAPCSRSACNGSPR